MDSKVIGIIIVLGVILFGIVLLPDIISDISIPSLMDTSNKYPNVVADVLKVGIGLGVIVVLALVGFFWFRGQNR